MTEGRNANRSDCESTTLDYARTPATQRSGLARTALACAIGGVALFLLCFLDSVSNALEASVLFVALSSVGLCLFGIVLGVAAAWNAKRKPALNGEHPVAVKAIWIGAIATPVIVSILWPSYFAMEASAKKVRSLANLRLIGKAVYVYTAKNGASPSDLHVLVKLGYIKPANLLDPSGPQDVGCNYFYVPAIAADPNSAVNQIVAYSDPAYHGGEGAAALFADGSVRWMVEPRFSQELARSRAAYEKAHGLPPVIIGPR